MICDRTAQLHAYHDRQLGPAAREAFEAHVAECQACAQQLAELRAVSRMVAAAPLPDVPAAVNERYYAAWDVAVAARGQGVLRISSWLTAAAAAVLVGSLLMLPSKREERGPVVANGAVVDLEWEAVALMPPPERMGDRPDAYVELAQWIAEDLSDGGGFQPR